MIESPYFTMKPVPAPSAHTQKARPWETLSVWGLSPRGRLIRPDEGRFHNLKADCFPSQVLQATCKASEVQHETYLILSQNRGIQ